MATRDGCPRPHQHPLGRRPPFRVGWQRPEPPPGPRRQLAGPHRPPARAPPQSGAAGVRPLRHSPVECTASCQAMTARRMALGPAPRWTGGRGRATLKLLGSAWLSIGRTICEKRRIGADRSARGPCHVPSGAWMSMPPESFWYCFEQQQQLLSSAKPRSRAIESTSFLFMQEPSIQQAGRPPAAAKGSHASLCPFGETSTRGLLRTLWLHLTDVFITQVLRAGRIVEW